MKTLGLLIGAVAIATCEDFGVTCTREARFGIRVIVSDSVTGTGLARGSVAIARENTFVDTLRAFSDSVTTGVIERAGTYRIEVSRTGYAPWSIDGVRVQRDECHVQPVTLTARLMPQ